MYDLFRFIHVFAQKSDRKCYWFTYDVDKGTDEEWTLMGSYKICNGHRIGWHFVICILFIC